MAANGGRLEMRYPAGMRGFTSQSETGRSNPLLPAWEPDSQLKIKNIGVYGEHPGAWKTATSFIPAQITSEMSESGVNLSATGARAHPYI